MMGLCGTVDGTQEFMYPRQTLYQLSLIPALSSSTLAARKPPDATLCLRVGVAYDLPGCPSLFWNRNSMVNPSPHYSIPKSQNPSPSLALSQYLPRDTKLKTEIQSVDNLFSERGWPDILIKENIKILENMAHSDPCL